MPITFIPKDRAVREITAKYETTSGKIEDIRVRYYSPTVAETRRNSEDVDAKRKAGEIVWVSDTLAQMIESIPDLVDVKGKPFKIAPEFLESLSITNLLAIDKAIREDLDPK